MGGGDWVRVRVSYIQLGFHREDGVVLPFNENLKKVTWKSQLEQNRPVFCSLRLDRSGSPAHSLHHVCDQTVRDAWTGLLSQVEGVL